MEASFDFEKPIALLEKKLEELRILSKTESVDFSSEIRVIEKKLNTLIDETYKNLSPWQRVQVSRHPNRPYLLDYISFLFEDFFELHGDRLFGDDLAMVCGLAKFNYLSSTGKEKSQSVMVIGQQKGRNTKQKIERNFGMVKPEGYRKALRMMKLAADFQIPVLTFIDTPGAFPGIDAEERGQSEAIARCIRDMFTLDTPVLATVIGEGGSGGALAIGVADRVLMQEYSTYSVISPESCASILWSDSSMNEKAATIMKMTPEELLPFKVIDDIIPEPKGGAHRDWSKAAELLKLSLGKHLDELLKSKKNRIDFRRDKFRRMDEFAYKKVEQA